jgi:hypothetical protein
MTWPKKAQKAQKKTGQRVAGVKVLPAEYRRAVV